MQKRSQTKRTRWSIPQLERYIRATSLESNKVIFTEHAKQQMRTRQISVDVAMEVLRNGKIVIPPEPDQNHGTLVCRMQWYVAGDERKVVAAVSDNDEKVIVVTAI